MIVFLVSVVYSLLSSCSDSTTGEQSLDAEKLFTFQIYPLLESKCFACHGDDPKEIEGDFEMLTYASLVKGGESGKKALVPGHPDKSPIYLAAIRVDEDFAMPPKENDKLSQTELNDLKAWIAAGAPWPSEKRRSEIIKAGGWDYKGKIKVETSGALSETWANRKYNPTDIWAFQPIKKRKIPWEALDNDSSANPIDAFINQKLIERGISPAKEVDKSTLIRRASFDLLGLPPSNGDVQEFLKDDSPDAFGKWIDKLLDSPYYGEQWARHWLDVVRYADSDGFSNDYVRPNAWRYRDYVIRSFNKDKPYNEFILEQIAGDEINPDDPENLIATGFLRMGPWEHTGMSVEAETRQYFLDDVTNSVGEVFMSQPLRCARCHDHKFDPIPTKDYYQIQAVFATTQFAERPAPHLESENLSMAEEEKKRVSDFLNEAIAHQKQINEKEERAARRWMETRGMKYVRKGERGPLPDHKKPPRYLGLSNQELGYRKLLNKRIQRFKREKEAFDGLAYSVYNGPFRVTHSSRPMKMPENPDGALQETFILTGGSVYAKDEKVAPGILSALPSLQDSVIGLNPESTLYRDISKGKELRRLDFANWLIHPLNPLTSRSIVNRVWQYHFGKGLAENSNNFGVTGKKPTHAELLDWLALEFMENGWSIKHLHRLLMSSQAYQRSSQHENLDEVQTKDPDNLYLAVYTPRRLEAEEIRDALLFVSGELNLEQGGLPVRHEIHLEQALQPRHVMGSIAPAYQPSPKRAQRNRRTIYTLKLRGLTDPMMEVFNQPVSDLSCERRTASSVTPQVFMLFNDRSIRDRAVALANRISEKQSADSERVASTFEAVFNRKPSQFELQTSTDYLAKMTDYHVENPIPKEEYPKKVEREMFEEMTGEIFRFEEKLEVYDNYEADLKTHDLEPDARALADLAVVLFNSNEFMYVY
ncbi:MAG: PSD1 domain-containing protein [Cyclobacteriaceae bacterium]